jgi:hypothetical protein
VLASRVLVSASRRNNLSFVFQPKLTEPSRKQVRDREDALAVTRDVCTAESRSLHGHTLGEIPWFIDVASQFDG